MHIKCVQDIPRCDVPEGKQVSFLSQNQIFLYLLADTLSHNDMVHCDAGVACVGISGIVFIRLV